MNAFLKGYRALWVMVFIIGVAAGIYVGASLVGDGLSIVAVLALVMACGLAATLFAAGYVNRPAAAEPED